MLTSTCPWWTATARSIPIGCCALRLSSAHRRAVPGPGQRQSHSGRRPQRGVPVAVGRSADRPVRYITLADNASTTKLKGKQLCASCVIKMAGRALEKSKKVSTSDATFRKFPNQNQTDTNWLSIWKTKYQTDLIWASKSRHLYQIFKKVNIYAYKGIL